ncbi:hypothetical protein [Methanospirillum lacunae]|uniref:Uncharacterized protein n=1 Tax=Methanospirillum lacunae TaxID=668570 RepID=A0A2V2N8N5_9EURY|nr:hypothetical protein [Methanospirillum lacunae]PWR72868.1 hypothetical protein DK846_07935 [Methanospirillum lacunae]
MDVSQTTNSITCSHCANISSNQSSESLVETLSINKEAEGILVEYHDKEVNLSWIAGHISLSNLTPEVCDHHFGVVPPHSIQEIQKRALLEISAESLPSSFTRPSNNGNWTTPIQEQSNCGSC